MKLWTASIALLVLSLSLTSSKQQVSKQEALAVVNEREGLLIFTDCLPAKPYKIIGRVQKGGMGADYEGVRDGLITVAKRKYPQAEGLILEFHASDISFNANVIQFEH